MIKQLDVKRALFQRVRASCKGVQYEIKSIVKRNPWNRQTSVQITVQPWCSLGDPESVLLSLSHTSNREHFSLVESTYCSHNKQNKILAWSTNGMVRKVKSNLSWEGVPSLPYWAPQPWLTLPSNLRRWWHPREVLPDPRGQVFSFLHRSIHCSVCWLR